MDAKTITSRIILEVFPRDYITHGERERMEAIIAEVINEAAGNTETEITQSNTLMCSCCCPSPELFNV